MAARVGGLSGLFDMPARPPASKPETGVCWNCFTPARLDLMVAGLGSDCARRLGVTGPRINTEQDGPTLLDLLV